MPRISSEASLNATDIILIRHGETAWNAERRLQGHIDIPLNQAGHAQARALGHALAGEAFTAVISSDLQRAHQTAQHVLALHMNRQLPLHIEQNLRERCFGGFEGLTYQELAERYPKEFAAYKARDVAVNLPVGERAGEDFAVFYQRVVTALAHYGERFAGQKIVIVAHGGVLECAYRAANKLPLTTPRNFEILNASINRFQWHNGQLSMLQWGDIAHLQSSALDELDEQAA